MPGPTTDLGRMRAGQIALGRAFLKLAPDFGLSQALELIFRTAEGRRWMEDLLREWRRFDRNLTMQAFRASCFIAFAAAWLRIRIANLGGRGEAYADPEAIRFYARNGACDVLRRIPASVIVQDIAGEICMPDEETGRLWLELLKLVSLGKLRLPGLKADGRADHRRPCVWLGLED
jgi:hypothetical protein